MHISCIIMQMSVYRYQDSISFELCWTKEVFWFILIGVT